MITDREALALHLQRVHCAGRIEAAVFDSKFASVAWTTDQLLMVIAPPVKADKALGVKRFGVSDVQRLMKALTVAASPDAEDDNIEILHQDGRLVLREFGADIRLVCPDPSTVGTRVEPDMLKVLEEKAAELSVKCSVSRDLIDRVKAVSHLFKPSDEHGASLALRFGPKGGSLLVGVAESDQAEFNVPALIASEKYELLYSQHLVDVLVLADEGAIMHTGPGAQVTVVETTDGYRYFVSPLHRGADA